MKQKLSLGIFGLLVFAFAFTMFQTNEEVTETVLSAQAGQAVPDFDGSEGEYITMTEANTMIDSYQATYDTTVWAVSFGEDIVRDLLNTPGVNNLMIYFAEDVNGMETFVLVGDDQDGNDITQPVDMGILWPGGVAKGAGSGITKVGKP